MTDTFSSTEIVILSDSTYAEVLLRLLNDLGFTSVDIVGRNHFGDGHFGSNRFVISVDIGREHHLESIELDHCCVIRSIPWLRCVIDFNCGFVDIGPLFDHDRNPCYKCFLAMHSPYRETRKPTRVQQLLRTEYWLSLLAQNIFYTLSGSGFPLTHAGFWRYDKANAQGSRHACSWVPGCSECSGSPTATGELTADALVFEDIILSQAKPRPSQELQEANARLSRRLSQKGKVLHSSRLTTLPLRLECLLSCDLIENTHTLSDSTLGVILQAGAGLRLPSSSEHGSVSRWSPSAGNIGSVEIFVAVRDVRGLEPGFYFYSPHKHALAKLDFRRPACTLPQFFESVLGTSVLANADTLVILTGAYHRLARKYGPFAFRLTHLDAGAAKSQMKLVARSLGIEWVELELWPDDLIASTLNLAPFGEQVTAVAALRAGFPLDQQYRVKRLEDLIPRTKTNILQRIDTFRDLSEERLCERIYVGSRVLEAELSSLDTADRADGRNPDKESPFALGSLHSILSRRRTVRTYSDVSIDRKTICKIIDDFADLPATPIPLGMIVLADRVEGLARGVYRVDNVLRQLRRDPRGELQEPLANLFVMDEFGSAPVSFWLTADLFTLCSAYGPISYRMAMVRAGEQAHRIWIRALSLGADGAIVAGIVKGAACRLLKLERPHEAPLCAVTVGYPA